MKTKTLTVLLLALIAGAAFVTHARGDEPAAPCCQTCSEACPCPADCPCRDGGPCADPNECRCVRPLTLDVDLRLQGTLRLLLPKQCTPPAEPPPVEPPTEEPTDPEPKPDPEEPTDPDPEDPEPPQPDPETPVGLFNPQKDLKYLGAIRFPRSRGNGDNGLTFSYGGGSAVVRPSTNTFWATGHRYVKLHAEMTLPQPVISENMADLPIAEFVQPFGKVFGDVVDRVEAEDNAPQDVGIGGGMFWGEGENERLLLGMSSYYDAGYKMRWTHLLARPNTADPQAQGPFRVGSLNPGYYGGYMMRVPPEWAGKLAPAISGASQLAIITRTSTGPAAHGFDPDKLGAVEPVPAETYLNYPEGAKTRYAQPSYANGVRVTGGAFLPNGVLFVGWDRVGQIWYGGGSKEIDGVTYSDPCSGSHGVHSEGLRSILLCYDPADFLRVKNGELQPHEVRPYAQIPLDHTPLLTQPCKQVGGASFDHTRGLLYVVQDGGEKVGNYGRYPLVHVYEVR